MDSFPLASDPTEPAPHENGPLPSGQDGNAGGLDLPILVMGAALAGTAFYLVTGGFALGAGLAAACGMSMLGIGALRLLTTRFRAEFYELVEATTESTLEMRQNVAELQSQIDSRHAYLLETQASSIASISSDHEATKISLAASEADLRAALLVAITDTRTALLAETVEAKEALQTEINREGSETRESLTASISESHRPLGGVLREHADRQAEVLKGVEEVGVSLADGIHELTASLAEGFSATQDEGLGNSRDLRGQVEKGLCDLRQDLGGKLDEFTNMGASVSESENIQRDLVRQVTELRTGVLGKLDRMGTAEQVDELATNQASISEALAELHRRLANLPADVQKREIILSSKQIAPILDKSISKLSAKLLRRLDAIGAAAQTRKFQQIKTELLESVGELRKEVSSTLDEIGAAQNILDLGGGIMVLQTCLLDLGSSITGQLDRIEASEGFVSEP